MRKMLFILSEKGPLFPTLIPTTLITRTYPLSPERASAEDINFDIWVDFNDIVESHEDLAVDETSETQAFATNADLTKTLTVHDITNL